MVGKEGLPDTNENNSLHKGAGENASLKSKENFERRPYRFRPKGNIYFIRAGDKIKIGYSTRPLGRLKALQTSHPGKLELIGTRPGSREFETELHDRFIALHVRGEWFEAKQPLLRYIEENTPEGIAAAKARRLDLLDRARQPAPPLSAEARKTIAGLINMRAAHGADTPIGYRCSNLVELLQIPVPPRHLVERQMTDLERLRSQLN